MAQGLSLPVSDGSPRGKEALLLSPTCVFDMGFMETPSPTQVLSRNTLPPEKVALSPREVADFRVDENGSPEARTRPRQSALKAPPTEGVQNEAACLTFFGLSRSGQMAGDADVAIPPGERVNRQQDEGGGGDGPQDVYYGTQLPRCSAALDVVGPRPKRNAAFQPKRHLCRDEKPPHARKLRGRKKTADSKAPAPPQPAQPSSPPPRTRRRGRLPLAEPVATGTSSS
ncbi:uncharacterized protein LOC144144734 [Haemaphysalis longicornis]